jgi:hypothetical protein
MYIFVHVRLLDAHIVNVFCYPTGCVLVVDITIYTYLLGMLFVIKAQVARDTYIKTHNEVLCVILI